MFVRPHLNALIDLLEEGRLDPVFVTGQAGNNEWTDFLKDNFPKIYQAPETRAFIPGIMNSSEKSRIHNLYILLGTHGEPTETALYDILELGNSFQGRVLVLDETQSTLPDEYSILATYRDENGKSADSTILTSTLIEAFALLDGTAKQGPAPNLLQVGGRTICTLAASGDKPKPAP